MACQVLSIQNKNGHISANYREISEHEVKNKTLKKPELGIRAAWNFSIVSPQVTVDPCEQRTNEIGEASGWGQGWNPAQRQGRSI
jgi:hypothetical protein